MTSTRLPVARVREMEDFLDEWRVEAEIPGLSVAVLDRDGVGHAAGLGARDVESRAPATPDTLYSIASVTKAFTAAAVLRLTERGDLALDDEIREYVEFWNDVPGDPITVGDLLSHSSGMPLDYSGNRMDLFSRGTPASPLVTREDELRHANGAADHRIADPPGYLYSNRGYHVLGEVVEAVADRSHAEVVAEELFDPLGMDRSTVGFGEISEVDDDAMTPYVIEDGEPVPQEFDLAAGARPPHAAGGIASSVTEVAAFLRCLLNEGRLDGTRVLEADTVEAMTSHKAPTWETIDGRKVGYGYGWHVRRLLEEPLVDHTGSTPGASRAFVGILPERGLGAALAANTSDVPIGALGRGVLAIAAGEVPEVAVPTLSMRRKLSAVTGTYEGYRGGLTVTVQAGDGAYLEVDYGDGPGWEFPAFPTSTAHDEYDFYRIRPDGVREPVEFRETGAGMVLQCNVDRLERTGSVD